MHPHQVSMCESHQPNHLLFGQGNREQPIQGGEVIGQSLVLGDCYKDHTISQGSLHTLHLVGSNRYGMQSMGNSLYSHDRSLFHQQLRHGKVDTD